MADYKESNISGKKWQRAHTINISNNYNQTPVINFFEEEIVEIDGTTYQKNVGHISETMIEPTTQFTLLNPLDGTAIGTATYQDLQVMLYSLYLNLANRRDNP